MVYYIYSIYSLCLRFFLGSDYSLGIKCTMTIKWWAIHIKMNIKKPMLVELSSLVSGILKKGPSCS